MRVYVGSAGAAQGVPEMREEESAMPLHRCFVIC